MGANAILSELFVKWNDSVQNDFLIMLSKMILSFRMQKLEMTMQENDKHPEAEGVYFFPSAYFITISTHNLVKNNYFKRKQSN